MRRIGANGEDHCGVDHAFFFCFIISAFDLCRSWQQNTKRPFPRHYGSSSGHRQVVASSALGQPIRRNGEILMYIPRVMINTLTMKKKGKETGKARPNVRIRIMIDRRAGAAIYRSALGRTIVVPLTFSVSFSVPLVSRRDRWVARCR